MWVQVPPEPCRVCDRKNYLIGALKRDIERLGREYRDTVKMNDYLRRKLEERQ